MVGETIFAKVLIWTVVPRDQTTFRFNSRTKFFGLVSVYIVRERERKGRMNELQSVFY